MNSDWTDRDETLIEEASAIAENLILPWVKQLKAGLAGGDPPGRFYPLLASLLVSLLQLIGTLAPRR